MMVLREPIAKEFSFYNHALHDFHASENKPTADKLFSFLGHPDDPTQAITFEKYVDYTLLPSIESGHGSSLYSEYLEGWFDLFGDDHRQSSILVLSHDELVEDEETSLNRIKELHGVGSSATSSKGSISCTTRAKLEQAFAPYNQQLYQILQDYPGPRLSRTDHGTTAVSSFSTLSLS